MKLELEISDETMRRLTDEAAAAGVSVEQVVLRRLDQEDERGLDAQAEAETDELKSPAGVENWEPEPEEMRAVSARFDPQSDPLFTGHEPSSDGYPADMSSNLDKYLADWDEEDRRRSSVKGPTHVP
ncbi:MAG: hypothetical protein ACFCVE_14545 [Phycisphaerae bacterium]